MYTLYYGTIIHSLSLEKFEIKPNTVVGVDDEGIIQFVEPGVSDVAALAADKGLKTEDYTVYAINSEKEDTANFFFPGFIDTHIHASQYPNCGIFGNSTLLDWLTTYTFPLEASYSDLKLARDSYSRVVEKTLISGTTTAAYFTTIHPEASKLLADIALEKGQRAIVGSVCMDRNAPDYYVTSSEDAVENSLQVIDHINKIDPKHEIVSPCVTPRFSPSCTSDLMAQLGKLAKERNLHVQTHISENLKEIEWVLELFPECKNYADTYLKYGLLTDRTILGHALHLTDEEIDMIVEQKSGISHCPISNSSLTSGECRVAHLLRCGCKVGLGTDISGGYSPSILTVCRQALLVSRHLVMSNKQDEDKLSIYDVLYLATLGGAKVVDREAEIGNFVVGKKWDAQYISLNHNRNEIDLFPWQFGAIRELDGSVKKLTQEEKIDLHLTKWFFNGDDRNTVCVWVNGRLVVNKA